MSEPLDLVGQKIGRLTVIRNAGRTAARKTRYECRCDCGETIVAIGSSLLSGHTKSCGCLKAEMAARINFKHGYRGTRIYKIWANMKSRCSNPNTPAYGRYGGRGISLCEEWESFEHFYEWAVANGYSDDLTIDRIDNDGNYCPENCRWITQKEQCNNKRNNHLLTHNGETLTISEWAQKLNVNYFSLHDRITKLGWSAEKALTTQIKESVK